MALIPTTIGALLSAIGIAGMDRLVRHNVLALSGRSVEASGDVDVLLLDKTGTITLGNREATEFIPMPGSRRSELAEAAQMSSLADETPEGRSIVVLAKELRHPRARASPATRPSFVPFTARDPDERRRRQRQPAPQGRRRRDRSAGSSEQGGRAAGRAAGRSSTGSAARGARRWRSAATTTVLGVIYLKDIVKEGMRARFDQLRAMGIRTMMVTGDNKLTAAKIAEEAGVDDFLAEATPERSSS